jgi:hypothetical protein
MIPTGLIARKVTVSPETQCWEWNGYKHDGYGRFSINSNRIMAHRYAYEQLIGPIPEGLVLDHLCRNRPCVNPRHLRVVTRTVNSTENTESVTMENKSKTHCDNGHPFTEANTYPTGDGRRCRICAKEYQKKYKQRKNIYLGAMPCAI